MSDPQPQATTPSSDPETLLLDVVGGLRDELHPGHAGRQPPTLGSSLDRDLGLDSLGRVELVLRLEKAFDLALPEQLALEAETPQELLRAVQRARGESPAAARQAGAKDARPSAMSGTEQQATAVAPASAQTLLDVLDWQRQHSPQHTHIRFYSDRGDGETITHAQLHTQAERIAGALQARGIGVGDTVALMLPTASDYFYSFFGILLAGAIPVPIYPPVRPAQIEDHLRRQTAILRNCQARALITISAGKAVAQLLRARVETLRTVATAEDLIAQAASYARPRLRGDDIGFLQYTSGSTGNPKGVVLSHANLLANIEVDGRGLAVNRDDVFVSWLPLYHDMGLIGAWLGSLYHGVPLIAMSPLAFLSRPQRWLRAIHEHRGTLSAAPNFAFELCLRRIEDRELEGLDLSSWRCALNGAEAISPQTLQRFQSRFGRYGLREGVIMPVYGLAECAVGLCFPPVGRGPVIDSIDRDRLARDGRAEPVAADDPRARQLVCCGRALPGHEIRIADASGHELPERQEGRLQFRGPSATRGYYRNPEQSKALFAGDWLETGDLGYLAGGELYLTGRSKDLIIRAGRNIYPDELEAAIGEIDGVRKGRVAVFGSTDAQSGTERLVIVAETRVSDAAGRERLQTEINTIASDLLAAPPDDIVLAPDNTVLKTSSGKIRRAASREVYEQGRIGQAQTSTWRQLLRFGLAGAGPGLRRLRRSLGDSLYAAYAWLAVGACVAVTVPVLLLTPVAGWRWAIIRGALRSLAATTGIDIRLEGREHLPNGPCVLVANHASYVDVFALLARLPLSVSFLAKAELQRNPIARRLLRQLDTHFVDRGDRAQSTQTAARLASDVRAGSRLMVFPEATFRRMPGLLPFRMGAFTTAVDAGVPVVPVAIRGTRSILRSGTWFPRRGRVSITIGPALNPEPEAERWQQAVRLREAARMHILRYCGEPDLGADAEAFDLSF